MSPSSGKAQLFTDPDYGGAVATLETGSSGSPGFYNIGDGTGPVQDNTVSSLKVADGYQVTLYADRDGQGASQTYTTNTPRLTGFNDVASSVTVTRLGEAEHNDFQMNEGDLVFVLVAFGEGDDVGR